MASFTIRADTAGLEAYLHSLGDKAEDAVRPAAQAGAEVLYQAARANVAKINRKTGRLAGSIYQAYSKAKSGPGVATYNVSWRTKSGGGPQAPHGHLIENGHWMYYVTVRDAAGRIRLAVRPEMRGKPAPKRRKGQDNRAAFDAYYVPLPNGPQWVPAQPFIRPAMAQARAAQDAAVAELLRQLKAK